MMWSAPHIGVAHPRKTPGRATGVGASDVPIDVQTYWTPDPRRTLSDAIEDRGILDGLRPNKRKHPRLVVQPPELSEKLLTLDEDAYEKAVEALNYEDYVAAPLLRLDEHPELADRAPTPAPQRAGAAAQSTIVAEPTPDEALLLAAAQAEADAYDRNYDESYGDQELCPVTQLEPGDMVVIDEETQTWAVVECTFTDVADDELICIPWLINDEKKTGDQSLKAGELSLPNDATIPTRHPHTSGEETTE